MGRSSLLLVGKQQQQILGNRKEVSYEYVRGLVDGEGCFCFHPGWMKPNGRKYKTPAFVIAMHDRDYDLLEAVREKLGIKNPVRTYDPPVEKDGYRRGRRAVLMVKDFNQLKDIVIPLFYKKLRGYKGKQFAAWLERIGNDPDVTDKFRSLYNLWRLGVYDKDPKFTQKFFDA